MRQLNLLPADLQQKQQTARLRNVLIVLIIPTVILMGGIHYALVRHIDRLNDTVQNPPSPLETPEIQALRREIQSVRSGIESLVGSHYLAMELFARQLMPASVLKDTANGARGKVWFDQMEMDMTKRVFSIKGKSFNTRLVSEYMLELKKMPYFSAVDLESVSKENAGGQAVEFLINCHLR